MPCPDIRIVGYGLISQQTKHLVTIPLRTVIWYGLISQQNKYLVTIPLRTVIWYGLIRYQFQSFKYKFVYLTRRSFSKTKVVYDVILYRLHVILFEADSIGCCITLQANLPPLHQFPDLIICECLSNSSDF
jgi:hypothetical protein